MAEIKEHSNSKSTSSRTTPFSNLSNSLQRLSWGRPKSEITLIPNCLKLKQMHQQHYSEENNYGTVLKLPRKERPSSYLPTFWEFVQAVISEVIDDGHWNPMYKFCSVCHNVQLKTLNFVLRFENLNIEAKLFLKALKRNQINSSIAAVTSNKFNSNSQHNINSTELAHLYFSTISETDVKKLYEIYKYDFILFNYTFQYGKLSFPK